MCFSKSDEASSKRDCSNPLDLDRAMKNAKNKILLMASPVTEEERTLAGRKQRQIDERLRVGTNRDKFELIPKLHLRVNDLQQALLQLQSEHQPPYIVHFSAQGTEDGNLMLENAAGHSQIVSGSAVVELFKILKDGIRAIILDGSYTEKLGRQLEGTVEYIVSMKGRIDGDSAVIFDTHLYQGLSHGYDFNTAFELGKNQLQFERAHDYGKPVLHEKKVVAAKKPSQQKRSVKYLTGNRKICAASSV